MFIGDLPKCFSIVFMSSNHRHHLPHTLKQTQNFVFIHILQYVYFRSMLRDYLSVSWIVFWDSMFAINFPFCHHPNGKALRLLQFSVHSHKVCSFCDSLSFFLLGNSIMYHLSICVNKLGRF